MYGELGYRPWELHKMLWADLQLAIKGRNDKNDNQEAIARRLAAAIVGAGMNDKLKKSFDKFWPAPKVEKKINARALDQLRRFKVLEAANKLNR